MTIAARSESDEEVVAVRIRSTSVRLATCRDGVPSWEMTPKKITRSTPAARASVAKFSAARRSRISKPSSLAASSEWMK